MQTDQFTLGDWVRFEYEGFPVKGTIVAFDPDGDAVVRTWPHGRIHVDVETLEPAEC